MPTEPFLNIRYSDRAYQVLCNARRSTTCRGGKIVSAEDIFLGLIMEGTGVAATLLKDEVGTIETPLKGEWSNKLGREVLLSFEGEAKNVFVRAATEAKDCYQKYIVGCEKPPDSPWISTEHILLSFTSDSDDSGTQRLKSELKKCGMSLPELRTDVLEFLFGKNS